MTYTFLVKDNFGKVAEYEINAASYTEAMNDLKQYIVEDGFICPTIEQIG